GGPGVQAARARRGQRHRPAGATAAEDGGRDRDRASHGTRAAGAGDRGSGRRGPQRGRPATPARARPRARRARSQRRRRRARVRGGTDLWSAERKRAPPGWARLDYLTYSIRPQVQGFDDVSLVETLGMQRVTVESARALSGGLPVVGGPVTLRPRGADPDPRQSSLFCAAWTIGSLKQLALARAEAVTYHEAFGPDGLADAEPFAVYRALAEARLLA